MSKHRDSPRSVNLYGDGGRGPAPGSEGEIEELGPLHLSIEAAERLAALINKHDLQRFLHCDLRMLHTCLQGFRETPDSVNRSIVRKRFARELVRRGDLARLLLVMPGTPWRRWARAFGILDRGWIKNHWRFLLYLPGEPILAAAALALDPRRTVRSIGERLLRRRNIWNAPDAGRDDDASITEEEDEPRGWVALMEVLGVAGSRSRAPDIGEEESELPVSAELDRTRKQLSKAERETKKLQRRIETLEKRIEADQTEWKERRAAFDEERRQLRERIEELQRLLEQERRERERLIEDRVAAERRRLLGLVGLRGDLIEKSAEAVSESEDLLTRVREVLEQQRKANQGHAACSEIRAEIARLEQALEEIALSRRESLLVIPELSRVEEAVRERITELNALLGTRRLEELERSPRAAMFIEEIDAASPDEKGLETLDELTDLLRMSRLRKRLGDDLVRALRKRIADRRDVIRQIIHEREELAAAAKKAREQPARELGEEDVRRALQEAPEDLLVVVDGYNMTKNVEALSRIEVQQGLAASRNALIELFRRQFKPVQVLVVFDGEGALEVHDEQGNVRVAFAPQKKDAHNADDLIVKVVRREKKEHDRPCWVVTYDRGLRKRCAKYCTGFLDPEVLYAAVAGA